MPMALVMMVVSDDNDGDDDGDGDDDDVGGQGQQGSPTCRSQLSTPHSNTALSHQSNGSWFCQLVHHKSTGLN